VSSVVKSTGKVAGNKDKLEPEDYNTKGSCKDAGYYWYDNDCHKCREPYAWNVYEEREEAGAHEKIEIPIGVWKIDIRLIIAFACFVALVYLLRTKEVKKIVKK
jgi:hypothetical protein